MQDKKYLKDEILEAIWVLREKKLKSSRDNILKQNRVITREALEEAVKSGFLIENNEDIVEYSEEAYREAQLLMRRHRLAERLLSDVLDMNRKQLEEQACEFEHILSPETTDSICTLLGHPRECPHGGDIPEGKCCTEFRSNPSRVVIPLSELLAGESAKILYITSGTEKGLLGRLNDLGISPGERITLHQSSPVGVVRAGQTDIALEKEILENIFVRRPAI